MYNTHINTHIHMYNTHTNTHIYIYNTHTTHIYTHIWKTHTQTHTHTHTHTHTRHKQLQLLSEVRTIILPRDLHRFNELTVHKEIAAKKVQSMVLVCSLMTADSELTFKLWSITFNHLKKTIYHISTSSSSPALPSLLLSCPPFPPPSPPSPPPLFLPSPLAIKQATKKSVSSREGSLSGLPQRSVKQTMVSIFRWKKFQLHLHTGHLMKSATGQYTFPVYKRGVWFDNCGLIQATL